MSFANNKDHINRKGRPKGSVDKDTRKIREAYQMLVEDNLENLSGLKNWVSSHQKRLSTSL